MAFVKRLGEALSETRSEITVKQYLSRLIKINNDTNPKSLAFLKKTEDIVNRIEGMPIKDTTKESYYTALVAIINLYTRMKKAKDVYYKKMIDHTVKIKEDYKNNVKSEKQIKNDITFDEIVEIRENLKKNGDVMGYFIISLYTMFPPRRNLDYSNMVFIIDGSKPADKTKNYLMLKDKKFIFNVYKTSTVYDSQEFDIDKELMDTINYYINNYYKKIVKRDIHNGDQLLILENGKPINNSNGITRLLNKAFSISGKSIGSTVLRHIFLSNTFNNDLQKRKEIANKMAHSVGMGMAYQKF